MKVLKFKLYGKTAFFKKPDVNEVVYYTYGHPHRLIIMGIIGSVIGLSGYNKQYMEKTKYPEFYEKLQNIRISVVPPRKSKGYFNKKIQVFNNSVGYASKEKGRNLIIQEQWLEDPSWKIYLDLSDIEKDIEAKIYDYFLNQKAEYMPYLGKNDHPANISDVEILEISKTDKLCVIDSLIENSNIKILNVKGDIFKSTEIPYVYKDYMPYGLDEEIVMYLFRQYIYTNRQIQILDNKTDIWTDEKKNIVFI